MWFMWLVKCSHCVPFSVLVNFGKLLIAFSLSRCSRSGRRGGRIVGTSFHTNDAVGSVSPRGRRSIPAETKWWAGLATVWGSSRDGSYLWISSGSSPMRVLSGLWPELVSVLLWLIYTQPVVVLLCPGLWWCGLVLGIRLVKVRIVKSSRVWVMSVRHQCILGMGHGARHMAGTVNNVVSQGGNRV